VAKNSHKYFYGDKSKELLSVASRLFPNIKEKDLIVQKQLGLKEFDSFLNNKDFGVWAQTFL
jgi:hypothetical protein